MYINPETQTETNYMPTPLLGERNINQAGAAGRYIGRKLGCPGYK
jgi:hypothetical protein